jgi:carboxypeptidase C (cathepsin A)
MQAGSYLLNQDLQMIWGDQQTFVQHWQFAQTCNAILPKAIERVIKAARRKQLRVTGKADKFINDLNAKIEQGWTGAGQTNRLLGCIAMRSYISGHVLYADSPLEGRALIQDIIRIAQ